MARTSADAARDATEHARRQGRDEDREYQRVFVCTFLDVCTTTLDGYRAAVAEGNEGGIAATANHLRRAVLVLGLGRPAVRPHGPDDRACGEDWRHTLESLHQELGRLAPMLQSLTRP